jgi:hypothetical protein
MRQMGRVPLQAPPRDPGLRRRSRIRAMMGVASPGATASLLGRTRGGARQGWMCSSLSATFTYLSVYVAA